MRKQASQTVSEPPGRSLTAACRRTAMLLSVAALASLAACGNACINNGTINCSTGEASSSSSGGGSASSSSSGGGTSSSSSGAGNAFTGSVNPSTIKLGSTAQISVEITDSLSTAETGLSTSIEFSSTLAINVAPAYSCSPGTVTTDNAGASIQINLSGASVPAAATCALTVTVTPPSPGEYKIIAAEQDLTLTVQ